MNDHLIAGQRPIDFIAESFIATREDHCQPVSVVNYRRALEMFLNDPGVPDEVSSLTPEHITMWAARLKRAGMPDASRAFYQRHLRVFLGWLWSRELTNKDLRRGLGNIRVPETRQPQATIDDVTRLLTVLIDGGTRHESDFRTRMRDIALVRVLWATGLRRRELLDIRLEDVDLRAREILINRGKTGESRRAPFDLATKQALLEYLGRQRGYGAGPLWVTLDGAPMSADALRQMMDRLRKKAGVNTPLHSFRRGFARRMRAGGLDRARGPWAELTEAVRGSANPLIGPGRRITREVANHPLHRAVRDLEDRLGILQGVVGAEDGDRPELDPLTDSLISINEAAAKKGTSTMAVRKAIARGDLIATQERPQRVSVNSLRQWAVDTVRQNARTGRGQLVQA